MRFWEQFGVCPHFLFSSFFRWLVFLACFMLSAPPLTPTHNCFAHNNSTSAKAASFAMYLVTRRGITSPTAIGLMPVFLSMLLKLHYKKLEPWSSETRLCWPSLLIWLGNSLIAWIDRKVINWLRGEDALGTFWTTQLLLNSTKELQKDLCFNEFKSFSAIFFQGMKNFVSPGCRFFKSNEAFSVVGYYSLRW